MFNYDQALVISGAQLQLTESNPSPKYRRLKSKPNSKIAYFWGSNPIVFTCWYLIDSSSKRRRKKWSTTPQHWPFCDQLYSSFGHFGSSAPINFSYKYYSNPTQPHPPKKVINFTPALAILGAQLQETAGYGDGEYGLPEGSCKGKFDKWEWLIIWMKFKSNDTYIQFYSK